MLYVPPLRECAGHQAVLSLDTSSDATICWSRSYIPPHIGYLHEDSWLTVWEKVSIFIRSIGLGLPTSSTIGLRLSIYFFILNINIFLFEFWKHIINVLLFSNVQLSTTQLKKCLTIFTQSNLKSIHLIQLLLHFYGTSYHFYSSKHTM